MILCSSGSGGGRGGEATLGVALSLHVVFIWMIPSIKVNSVIAVPGEGTRVVALAADTNADFTIRRNNGNRIVR